ncbi:MAG: lysophospholipid acyltransferase family protein [Pseudomonadota bacterium]
MIPLSRDHTISTRCISALLRCLSVLPWKVLYWLGSLTGNLFYAAKSRLCRLVQANLAIAYPHLPATGHTALSRQVLRHTVITYLEMPRIWHSPDLLPERIDHQGLPQVMRDLVAEGRGLILAIPHLGNWEMVSSATDTALPITGLYRPPRQTYLEPLLVVGRNKAHVRTVPITQTGIKALHTTLQAGDVVAILPDQVPKRAGAAAISAPFFGRESATMVLLNRLARRHQTPVLFVWAKRLPQGTYQIRFFVADDAIRSADARTAATALNQAVERCIADCPAQYQWAYRRFKTVRTK